MSELWLTAITEQKMARTIAAQHALATLLFYDQATNSLAVLVYGDNRAKAVTLTGVLLADEPTSLLDERLNKAMVDAAAHFEVVARLTSGVAA